MPELGSQPIQPQYVEQMNDLARFLDKVFNGKAKGDDRKTGFVLLVFPFGDHQLPGGPQHRTNYISNAHRDDVVTLLKEQIAYFEGQPEGLAGRA